MVREWFFFYHTSFMTESDRIDQEIFIRLIQTLWCDSVLVVIACGWIQNILRPCPSGPLRKKHAYIVPIASICPFILHKIERTNYQVQTIQAYFALRIEQRQRINGRNSLLNTSETKTSVTRAGATKTSAGLGIISSSTSGSTDHFRTEQPIAPAPSSDKVH
jgi:hypothetical protein